MKEKKTIPVIFNEQCLEFKSPGHPESPDRVRNIYNFLKEKNYEFIQCQPCSEDDLKLCHTRELINNIKQGNFFNADTPNLPHIYDYARLAVGGAILAMELAEKEKITFSLLRPPGHHAGQSKPAGFCYFNNIAIAVRKSEKKCAIIDIDCHHGNGTQEIFLGDRKVKYFSIHRNHSFYPGTGLKSIDNCINYPLNGPSRTKWMEFFNSIISSIKDFSPEIIAVSAGFDAYKDDPLAGLGLSEDIYKEVGYKITELGRQTFCVLEGGYSKKLPQCTFNFLEGLKG